MSGKASRYTRNGALEFAAELGMNTEEFGQCLDDKRHLGLIQEQQRAARQRGISGTPTVTVNGEWVGNNPARIIGRVHELAGIE